MVLKYDACKRKRVLSACGVRNRAHMVMKSSVTSRKKSRTRVPKILRAETGRRPPGRMPARPHPAHLAQQLRLRRRHRPRLTPPPSPAR